MTRLWISRFRREKRSNRKFVYPIFDKKTCTCLMWLHIVS